jgi:hypothetical protein
VRVIRNESHRRLHLHLRGDHLLWVTKTTLARSIDGTVRAVVEWNWALTDDDEMVGHVPQKPPWPHRVAVVAAEEEDTMRDGDETEAAEAVAGDALRVVADSGGGGVGGDIRLGSAVAGACDDALDGDCTCTALLVAVEMSWEAWKVAHRPHCRCWSTWGETLEAYSRGDHHRDRQQQQDGGDDERPPGNAAAVAKTMMMEAAQPH